MKAAVFHKVGQPLAIEDVPDPTPGPDEVVVKVARCGICGSDLHTTEDPERCKPPGTVLGHEYAGEVVAIGREVERLKEGDHVSVLPLNACGRCANCLNGEPAFCDHFKLDGGGYAQYSLTRERQCATLPKTLSMDDGALVEPLSVGLHGVNLSEMKTGAKVLVIGLGPIGLAVVFWARRMGAGTIAVTATSDRRAALAKSMGASVFVPPSDEPVQAAIEALGGPPDIVFECVGAPGLIQRSIETVRKRGTVLVLGLCWWPDTINPAPAMISREVRIQPSGFYHRREFEMAIDTLDAGNLEPHAMITDTVSLNDMPPTFEALRHRTTQCKVLVDSWAD